MARGRKKVSTDSLDAKIEQQKSIMEKAKLRTIGVRPLYENCNIFSLYPPIRI